MDHITLTSWDESACHLRTFFACWAYWWLLWLHCLVVTSFSIFHVNWSPTVEAATRLATVDNRILYHRVVRTLNLHKDWLVKACFARNNALRAVCELWQHVVSAMRVVASWIKPVFDLNRRKLRQIVLLLPLSLGCALVCIFVSRGYLHHVLVNLSPRSWLQIDILYELTVLLDEVILLVLFGLALSCICLLTFDFLLIGQLFAFYVTYFRECEPLRQLQISVPPLVLLILHVFLDSLFAHRFVLLFVEIGASSASFFIHWIDVKLWLHVTDNRR